MIRDRCRYAAPVTWETPVRSWGQWCWHSLASPDPILDAQESVQLTWAGEWWLRCVQGRGGARAGTRAGRSPCFRTGQGSACRWPGLSVQAARAQPEGAAGRRSGSSCRNGRGNAASGQLPGAQGPGCSWGAHARSRTPGPATPARLSSGSACQRASLCSRGNRGTACRHVSRAPSLEAAPACTLRALSGQTHPHVALGCAANCAQTG